jgi:LPXTG-motif cell wall-anchored protein
MKIIKYICVCLLIGQIFVTPIFSYAEEISQEEIEITKTEDGQTSTSEQYDESLPGVYSLQEVQLSLEVKDSILYVGDKWEAKDNLVSATNVFGDPLEVTDLQVEGSVKTDTAGVYEVTYKNGSLSETAKVTVKENKATLKVKDSTLYVGDIWKPADNFVSATDKEGTELTVDNIDVNGTVDTSTAGNYKVTYMNGSLSESAKILVKKRVVNTRPDIKVGTIYENIPLTTTFYGYLGNIGTSFPDRDTYPEFHTGSNREGFKVPNDLVTTYTLKNGTKFIELPIIRTPKLYKGLNEEMLLDTGIISYSLDGITFTEDPPINPEEIKSIRFTWLKGGIVTYPSGKFITERISGKIAVDFSKVSGDELIVMENDSTGTSVRAGGTEFESKRTNYIINTKENKASLKVKDTTLYVGDKWTTADNLVTATDKEGNMLTVSDLEVEGNVNTNAGGVYEITYKNGSLSETAKVTVKENKATLKVKDTTLYVGDNWTATDNLVTATDKEGNMLTVSDLEVEGNVNTNAGGVYEITYKNDSLSETAKVTVKENKATLKVKDTTLYVGDNWTATDNLVTATDKEGNVLTVSDLEVEGNVNTNAGGVYEITYKNGSLSETAKVTVKENKATLKVKDSTLYVGDKWTAADNLVTATDKEGNMLTVSDLEVEGNVNTNAGGVYEITYKNGSLSETAKVTVKENKATLKVKDTTLYVGDNWTATDNLVTATDKEGNVLTVSDLEVKGTVDTSKAGMYEITYKNGSLSETAKVTVKENKATLKVKDTTLYVGDKWTAADNLVTATDKEGNVLTVSDLEVKGTVDTSKAGMYEITYKNGSLSETAKVTVKENKATLKVKDTTLYVGDKWTAADNLVTATDKEGNMLTVSDLEVEGNVNTNAGGVYEITYKNGSLSETAKVTVKENKATLKVKDSTLYVGDKWTAADNLVTATDKEGNMLTVSDLEVEGNVNTNAGGVYEITYKNGSLSEIAKVTVKENKATLKVKDTTLYVGDKWTAADNLVTATDKEGNMLTVSDLEVEGNVNTNAGGVYEITYKNGSLSETAKVTVKENKATLKVKDTTLYVGDKWTAADNLVTATDKEGNMLTVSDLEVEGNVNTNAGGVYEITYKNGSLSEIAKVTVKENKATLKVKDTTLYVGDKWTAADNLVTATDKEGNMLTVSDLEVEGNVNTNAGGVYEITYKNGSLSEIAKVTVKENKATLKVKDTTLYVGDKWTAADNLVTATDKEGNMLTVSDLEVEGNVNTNAGGVYEITYKNGSLSETAKVTVKENKATLKVKDSTLSVGDKWTAADNLVTATDKEGNMLTVSDLEVEGNVNTNAGGVYEITYKNGSLSETAKVTVRDVEENDQTSLEVKDSTLHVGDKWEVKENFISATDKNGNALTVEDLEIEESVNTAIAGVYEITYRNGNVSKTAKVTVKDVEENDQTSLEVKDSTIYVGDSWGAKDNFISATDKNGNTLAATDLQVEGTVNTKMAGVYEVTYKNGDLVKIVKVTVKEKKTDSASNGDKGGKQSQDKGTKNQQGKKNTNNSLPKTGEESSSYLFLMGVLLISGGLVVMCRRAKIKE